MQLADYCNHRLKGANSSGHQMRKRNAELRNANRQRVTCASTVRRADLFRHKDDQWFTYSGFGICHGGRMP